MTRSDVDGRNAIWVSRVVESAGDRLPLPTPVAGLLTVGLVPYLLTVAFVLSLPAVRSPTFVPLQALAATIAVVGPILIRHYDEHVFPTFVSEAEEVVVERRDLLETVDRYERFFRDRYWLTAVPWTGHVLLALVFNFGYFAAVGVPGYRSVSFATYLVFGAWWSLLTGIGLHGMLTTILCVRSVADLELSIDPLHHDGLGGLSAIGYFSIRATLMNSAGAFALPLAFAIAGSGGLEHLVYAAVAGYVGILLVSFLYPTLYVNRRAQEVREAVLREKRRRIRELQARTAADSDGGRLDDLETQLRIRTLRDDFHEHRDVNLYPLSVSILLRLGSSILLPIAFTLLDTYVFTN